jgi:hypothetical protein
VSNASDLNDAEEIVAICRRRRQRQLIPIVNLPLPSPPPAAWEWIEAYRHWARKITRRPSDADQKHSHQT